MWRRMGYGINNGRVYFMDSYHSYAYVNYFTTFNACPLAEMVTGARIKLCHMI